jgi:hypothetical protein
MSENSPSTCYLFPNKQNSEHKKELRHEKNPMKSDILQTPSESESISDLLSLGSIEIIEIGHGKKELKANSLKVVWDYWRDFWPEEF